MARESVTVLLFGPARQATGTGELAWPVSLGGIPAQTLLRELARRFPRLAPTLRVSRFVRNGRYLARLSTRLRPGDEFAVHPPYGGG